jgi:hypothetical protein
MSLCSSLSTEFNRIRKMPSTNSIMDVSYKKLSEAALCRVEFWFKRIATLVVTKRPAIPSGLTEVPRTMKSLLKRYVCPSDEQASDIYYLFQQWIEHLLRYYRPKNSRSSVLTVDCVDQSVTHTESPLYGMLEDLLAVRALPYLADRKACDRRK